MLDLSGGAHLQRVPLRHLYVVDGPIELAGATLSPGDEARITDEAIAVAGAGRLLSIVQQDQAARPG